MDPALVQASAVAAASTMIGMTQAAMPTATATVQPSPTPLPSPTPMPLPTLPVTTVAAPAVSVPPTAAASGTTNCVQPLDLKGAGPTHRTQIINQTGAMVNISLTLYKPNAFGQCGSLSYANISGTGTVMADLPEGYWNAYAWASGKGKSFTVSGSYYVQPSQFDKLELCIRNNAVRYTPQC